MPRKRKAEQQERLPSAGGEERECDDGNSHHRAENSEIQDEKGNGKEKPEVTELGSDGRVQREETQAQPLPKGPCFKAVSWNVNGLRALLNKAPESLKSLVEAETPDYVCLQEHKLKEEDVEGMKQKLSELLPGYVSYWSCSTVKKGYSGTAVLLKTPKELLPGMARGKGKQQQGIASFFGNKTNKGPGSQAAKKASSDTNGKDIGSYGPRVHAVTYDMAGQPNAHSGEGRLITVEYDKFFLVGAYVPNSGQKLERLKQRTEQWDQDLRSYLLKLQERKPAILTGDLNVAHLDIDIHNVTAKHIPKSAGTTPAERESFGGLLSDGFVDAFRRFHPAAKGCFTQWSTRASNRPFNKGLRLDYFVVAAAIADAQQGDEAEEEGGSALLRLLDCQHLDQAAVNVSDHCPITLILAGI